MTWCSASIGPGGIEMKALVLATAHPGKASIGPGGIEIRLFRAAESRKSALQSDRVELK